MKKRGIISKRERINKKKNKKAIQLTLETVLLLILTVVAVVILLGFFTQTSQHLFGRIKSYFTYSNVDAVTESCNVLSSSGSSYAFCCEKKEVKYYDKDNNDEKAEGEFNCDVLADKVFTNNKINKISCEGISC